MNLYYVIWNVVNRNYEVCHVKSTHIDAPTAVTINDLTVRVDDVSLVPERWRIRRIVMTTIEGYSAAWQYARYKGVPSF